MLIGIVDSYDICQLSVINKFTLPDLIADSSMHFPLDYQVGIFSFFSHLVKLDTIYSNFVLVLFKCILENHEKKKWLKTRGFAGKR